jgi:MFS family permease
MTLAVQLGFVVGTFVFAWLAISDRYSPRIVFFLSAIVGAAANAAIVGAPGELGFLLSVRFAAGFFLAGVYPVGMKIASSWYDRNVGLALGWLVGALVLGTAIPHLIRGFSSGLPWQSVILSVSALAISGGLAVLVLVPDGPHRGARATFDPKALATIFRSPRFRSSAFGYFGHMWELYAYYTFLPMLIAARLGSENTTVSVWAFLVIASGAIGCIGGGYLSRSLGSVRVASLQLRASALCCVVSPLVFLAPLPIFLTFLLVWGIVVVGDSPQFSAVNARHAPPELIGSALTIVNCIGFSITLVSIALLTASAEIVGPQYMFLALAVGPAVGLAALKRLEP